MNTKLIRINQIKKDQKGVLCYGHFNTIHPGHIRYLKYAASQSDNLYLALIGDGNNINEKNFEFSQSDRAESLSLLKMINSIVLLENDEIDEVVPLLRPYLLILGKEFKLSKNTKIRKAISIQKKLGSRVEFETGIINYASAELLEKSQKDLNKAREKEFLYVCKRQNITKEKLLTTIDEFKSTKLLVVGDIIVDQYSACEALGMSAEAPIVVVKELNKKNFLGGAGIVASHIKALGAECKLLSVIGDDDNKKFVFDEIKKLKIPNHLLLDPQRPTTFKKRYIVENQKLFRVSNLEDKDINTILEKKLIKKIESEAYNLDGIVLSDFVYGVITDSLIKSIQRIAKENNLMLFADIQCSSQYGSITKFKNFSLLCPNEREARFALHDKSSGLEKLSQKLIAKTTVDKLVMKLGSAGFVVYDLKEKNNIRSQAFPALSANPLDVAGAGDSLLATMACGLSTKSSIMEIAALSACVAKLSVETMGNTPINVNILKHSIEEIFN